MAHIVKVLARACRKDRGVHDKDPSMYSMDDWRHGGKHHKSGNSICSLEGMNKKIILLLRCEVMGKGLSLLQSSGKLQYNKLHQILQQKEEIFVAK